MKTYLVLPKDEQRGEELRKSFTPDVLWRSFLLTHDGTLGFKPHDSGDGYIITTNFEDPTAESEFDVAVAKHSKWWQKFLTLRGRGETLYHVTEDA